MSLEPNVLVTANEQQYLYCSSLDNVKIEEPTLEPGQAMASDFTYKVVLNNEVIATLATPPFCSPEYKVAAAYYDIAMFSQGFEMDPHSFLMARARWNFKRVQYRFRNRIPIGHTVLLDGLAPMAMSKVHHSVKFGIFESWPEGQDRADALQSVLSRVNWEINAGLRVG